ncbi:MULTISPECIES: hypothetical protein [unclassified Streptomyces]|uniref:hypothetical protein n=1 Tax=unclassified Streptomyces TaxID=2593676 RepID=UPI003441F624
MTHPVRAMRAERLRRELLPLDAVVVSDPDPGGPRSTLRTATAAWSVAHPRATHHLVLQDDAEPCPDFARQLIAAVAVRPRSPLALFTEWGSVTATMTRWAALSGRGFAECVDDYVPTVGLVLPRELAEDLVGFVARECHAQDPDDVAMHRFLATTTEPVLSTVPHLVDHDGPQSLLGHASHMGLRRSPMPRAAGEDRFDDDPLLAPPLIPVLSWNDGRAVCARWDPSVRTHVGTVPTRDVLGDNGADITDALTALGTVLADPRCGDLGTAMDRHLLEELWLTAVAVGALAPQDPVHPTTESAARALGTMGPGGLRTLQPSATLARHRTGFTRLVGDGVSAGLAVRRRLSAPGAVPTGS